VNVGYFKLNQTDRWTDGWAGQTRPDQTRPDQTEGEGGRERG